MIFYFFLAGALQYNPFAAAKSVAGISVPKIFLIPSLVIQTWSFIGMACAHPSMVAQAGAPKGAPVSKKSGNANSVWATTQGISVSGGSHYNYFLEAAQWLLPFTVCTRNTFVPIRGCAMHNSPRSRLKKLLITATHWYWQCSKLPILQRKNCCYLFWLNGWICCN